MLIGQAALAQPSGRQAAPDLTVFPRSAVQVVRYEQGFRYADKGRRTLYAVDATEAWFRRGSMADYCDGDCPNRLKLLFAADGAVAIGAWRPTQIGGRSVWTYRGAAVYTFVDDRPGQAGADGYQGLFKPIEYVPKEPSVKAPNLALPLYDKGHWYLATKDRRYLVARAGECSSTSCLALIPLAAGLAAKPFGQWSVIVGADRLQWAHRGRPVFMADQPDTSPSPEDGERIPAQER
jgi:predicted lipoprotein with Yx(FWY)xxD motif